MEQTTVEETMVESPGHRLFLHDQEVLIILEALDSTILPERTADTGGEDANSSRR